MIIPEMCEAIWQAILPTAFPKLTKERFEEIKKGFEELRGFPNVIGALDGKHVRVKNLPLQGSMYHCYKGFFSVILLAMCDGKCRFTFVDIGAHGSVSDGHVFKKTKLYEKLMDETLPIPPPNFLPNSDIVAPSVILADEAFSLHPNVLTPFPGRYTGKLSESEVNLNHRELRNDLCHHQSMHSAAQLYQNRKSYHRA